MSSRIAMTDERMAALVTEVYLRGSIGNSPTAHLPHPNKEGPLCQKKRPAQYLERLTKKPTQVYPEGWLDWCDDCRNLVEGGGW